MTALVVLLTVVVAILSLLVVGLLRSHATILRALHHAGIDLDPDGNDATASGRSSAGVQSDLDIRTRPGVPGPAGASGRRASDLIGTTPGGATRSVSVKGTNATLLAFLTAGCSTCAGFWSTFVGGVQMPDGVRLVIVAKGPELESPAAVADLAPSGPLTIQSSAAWEDYGIPVAPYFVLVDGRRGVVIGEGAAASWDRVKDLLDRALADAGLGLSGVRRRDLFSGDLFSGRSRADRVDDDLRRAGIEPGDPRLFHGDRPAADPSSDEPASDRPANGPAGR